MGKDAEYEKLDSESNESTNITIMPPSNKEDERPTDARGFTLLLQSLSQNGNTKLRERIDDILEVHFQEINVFGFKFRFELIFAFSSMVAILEISIYLFSFTLMNSKDSGDYIKGLSLSLPASIGILLMTFNIPGKFNIQKFIFQEFLKDVHTTMRSVGLLMGQEVETRIDEVKLIYQVIGQFISTINVLSDEIDKANDRTFSVFDMFTSHMKVAPQPHQIREYFENVLQPEYIEWLQAEINKCENQVQRKNQLCKLFVKLTFAGHIGVDELQILDAVRVQAIQEGKSKTINFGEDKHGKADNRTVTVNFGLKLWTEQGTPEHMLEGCISGCGECKTMNATEFITKFEEVLPMGQKAFKKIMKLMMSAALKYRRKIEKRLSKADKEGDGKLDNKEINQLLKRNKTNVLTSKEFNKLDQDGDGELDPHELVQLQKLSLKEHEQDIKVLLTKIQKLKDLQKNPKMKVKNFINRGAGENVESEGQGGDVNGYVYDLVNIQYFLSKATQNKPTFEGADGEDCEYSEEQSAGDDSKKKATFQEFLGVKNQSSHSAYLDELEKLKVVLEDFESKLDETGSWAEVHALEEKVKDLQESLDELLADDGLENDAPEVQEAQQRLNFAQEKLVEVEANSEEPITKPNSKTWSKVVEQAPTGQEILQSFCCVSCGCGNTIKQPMDSCSEAVKFTVACWVGTIALAQILYAMMLYEEDQNDFDRDFLAIPMAIEVLAILGIVLIPCYTENDYQKSSKIMEQILGKYEEECAKLVKQVSMLAAQESFMGELESIRDNTSNATRDVSMWCEDFSRSFELICAIYESLLQEYRQTDQLKYLLQPSVDLRDFTLELECKEDTKYNADAWKNHPNMMCPAVRKFGPPGAQGENTHCKIHMKAADSNEFHVLHLEPHCCILSDMRQAQKSLDAFTQYPKYRRMELNKLIEELKEYITQHETELDSLQTEVNEEVTNLQAGNLDRLDHLQVVQMKHEAKKTTLAGLNADMAAMQKEVGTMLANEGVRREDTAQVWLNRHKKKNPDFRDIVISPRASTSVLGSNASSVLPSPKYPVQQYEEMGVEVDGEADSFVASTPIG